jgi:hypothetical protein
MLKRRLCCTATSLAQFCFRVTTVKVESAADLDGRAGAKPLSTVQSAISARRISRRDVYHRTAEERRSGAGDSDGCYYDL